MSHPDYENIGSPPVRFVEECSEIIKAVCKGERFGWQNWHPQRKLNNLEELKSEWMDVKNAYTKLINHIIQTQKGD